MPFDITNRNVQNHVDALLREVFIDRAYVQTQLNASLGETHIGINDLLPKPFKIEPLGAFASAS